MSSHGKKSEGPWPHGKPTMQCARCNGTGLDLTRVLTYEHSRAVVEDDKTRAERVVCERCGGRGRVLNFGLEARVSG